MANKEKEENSLFRKEVIQRKKTSFIGKSLVISPISFSIWTAFILAFAFTLLLFLHFGKYTKRHIVPGILVPSKGIINVYSDNSAIVSKRFVQQGDIVTKGQLLYILSTEHYNSKQEANVTKQIKYLSEQINIQNQRITQLEKNTATHKKLRDSKIITDTDYQKHLDILQSAQISLNDLEYRKSELIGKESYSVLAPTEGSISLLTAIEADRIQANTLLAGIIPTDSKLQGIIYVPSDAIGFVKKGQKVFIRYQAYPYQQFGLYEATIENIDSSILTPGDVKTPISLNVPFYRVTLSLKQQSINIYGRQQMLISGLLYEAVIFSEERRIWQWILNPIYSLRENLI
jgi:membrane fusion protein